MTREILSTLRAGDELDIVEINPDFIHHIERTLLAPARKRLPDTRISTHIAAVQEAPLEPGSYHCIISSLPFNNFDPALVRSILRRFDELLAPEGELCFFEYALLRRMRSAFGRGAEKERIGAISQIFHEIDARPGVRRQMILLNIPPAIKRTAPALPQPAR